jgi:preprotein translocase subunit SecA
MMGKLFYLIMRGALMLRTIFKSMFGSRNERLLRDYSKVVKDINGLEPRFNDMSDADLAAMTGQFKERIAAGETLNALLPEAFAVVRAAAVRTLGMRHYDVQLIGGMVLHYGKIAEMRTGEGKTLSSTLPAYLNALSGNSVHIITVNDYLAERDADWMRPVYEFLGLSVGVNLANMDLADKQAAYKCDIICGTNNEFGFDYLRDNMAYSLDQRVQGELSFAIIDEVDSILIDESRTPLIISGQAEESTEMYKKINSLIDKLDKQEEEDGPGDFSLDEKNKQAFLTEDGHEKVEQLLRESKIIDNDSGLFDLANITLMHYVNAALRAHKLFQRDVDYIVKDGQVIIVDEHTGRLMDGRRWSDGLHQATEAKENVEVQLENQTLATITFQNFFRTYEKLSGMTGTADTEAFEFQKIYSLEVVVIPTNKPTVRIDTADRVYLNATAKYKAIIKDIKERNEKGQPILVGTTSIEASELVSKLLQQENVAHEVLNAKHHEHEAKIVAEAGSPGAVMIATNMAGRGTDIVLGGNLKVQLEAAGDVSDAEKQAITERWQEAHDKVKAAGGLHVLGTERNESRRIDNQLRGRSGRQGDAGSSQFYLALDDNLLRIFAAGMITSLVQKLGFSEEDVIEHSMLSRSIEKAQRRVEGMNFDIRKQLLEYDDVSNDQRKVIYAQRLKLLQADSINDSIDRLIGEVAEHLVAEYIPADSMVEQWDVAGLENTLQQDFTLEISVAKLIEEGDSISAKEINAAVEAALREHLQAKFTRFGEDTTNDLQKQIMLQSLDQHWKDHLAAMDHLRQGIHLRGYAQKNPAQEYKRECFDMFTMLMHMLKREVIALLCRVELANDDEIKRMEQERAQQAAGATLNYQHNDVRGGVEVSAPANTLPPLEGNPKVGRNEPCPCGSGKKYKQCHGNLA